MQPWTLQTVSNSPWLFMLYFCGRKEEKKIRTGDFLESGLKYAWDLCPQIMRQEMPMFMID